MLVLLPDQSLAFPSADHIKLQISKHVNRNTSNIIIIDGRYVRSIDATVAKVFIFSLSEFRLYRMRMKLVIIRLLPLLQSIQTIVNDLRVQNKKVLLWNWGNEAMGVLCRLDKNMCNLSRDVHGNDDTWKTLNRELSAETVIRV